MFSTLYAYDKQKFTIQIRKHLSFKSLGIFIFTIGNKNKMLTDMFVEKIERDPEFWKNNMESQIVDFYMNHLLTEIADPKILL